MKKLFIWYDIDGNKRLIVAESLHQAKINLLRADTFFYKLKLKAYLTKQSFKRADLIAITEQLATMLKAGLPIVDILSLMAKEHHLLQWRWLLDQLKNDILAGQPLSTAVSYHPTIFPPLYKELVATGELTGQLEHNFENLAMQMQRAQLLQKHIKKALRYPIFLLAVTVVVTLIMLLVVLPKFEEVYSSFDASLPAFTQGLIAVSNLLKTYTLPIFIFMLATFAVFHFYLKKQYKMRLDKYSLKIPVLGKLLATTYLTQLFQTLTITQRSGIPLIAGLQATQNILYNEIFKSSLMSIISAIEQGSSFSQAVSKYAIFPSLCYQLILIGEESGTLDVMLNNLADYYQQQSEDFSDNLAQKIEPLMMSIMAIIIGGLVIAMYLPIFQLGNVIH
ncbi:protein transport protein HofC [Orbaceae bacterium ac157xtp]